MITEIKTWRIGCDRCRRDKTVKSELHPGIPAGWTPHESHGWGSYSKTEILCPKCAKKAAAEQLTKPRRRDQPAPAKPIPPPGRLLGEGEDPRQKRP